VIDPLAEALFSPRSIALIGASGDPTKNTSRPQRYLRKHGFKGAVYPINPTRDEVLGERAYPELAAVAAPIDHAFIMVQTSLVSAAVAQCVACGVKVATIFTDGFSEAGPEGAITEADLLAKARAGGLRLLGPNSIGIIATKPALALSVNAVLDLDALTLGRLGVISQSGSMLGTLLSRGQARGLGFSKLISVGNEVDLGVAELVELLISDKETKAILLFMEGIRNAERLGSAIRAARNAGKPVIAYKLGRSEVGQALAASHTGAMAGTDELTDAFFRRHGAIRVDMLETLLEIAPLAMNRTSFSGRRVAVMTTTGGGAAMVVDRLGTLGLEIVAPPDRLIAALGEKGIIIGKTPLTDLTLAGTKKTIYGAVLDGLLASNHCDAVVAVVGSSGQFHPELTIAPILEARPGSKPLAVFIAPDAPQSLGLLLDAGIAAFRTPEACADAVHSVLRWPAQTEDQAYDCPTGIENSIPETGGSLLNEDQASSFFERLGIAQAKREVLHSKDGECNLPFPVAAKVLSADIPHKTEAGGVELNISDRSALRLSVSKILARCRAYAPDAKIDGVLVQSMQQGLAEVMIGFRRDPQVGPIILVAAGGTLTELYRDFAVRLAPVGLDEAMSMIKDVRGLALLNGYRNLPRGDLDALAHAIHRLSLLGLLKTRRIKEAEINPLIVGREGAGVLGVDALLVLDS
jgi:acyl-CoA synthetase (NDP forming)